MRATPMFLVSAVLLVSGIVFFLYMGASFGNWGDVGVFSVTATLVGFGLFGILAARTAPELVVE